jgi:acyl phosphate:glycerol-3-phosphate acyltransferase
MERLALIIILSYLVGSIPTSVMYGKWFRGIDIRKHGSGNAGGTNVFRVLGWKPGVGVIIFDGLKGYIAVAVIARLYFDLSIPFPSTGPLEEFTIVQIIAGSAAILGHIWTLFAGFKGGKGIATAAGMMIGIAPIEFAVSVVVFMVVLTVSRFVSLGSISAAVAFPLTLFFRWNIFQVEIEDYSTLVYFSLVIAALLIFTHRGNIKRLIQGTENKLTALPVFGRKRKSGKNQIKTTP